MEKTFYCSLAVLCAVVIIILAATELSKGKKNSSTKETRAQEEIESSLLADEYVVIVTEATDSNVWDYVHSIQETTEKEPSAGNSIPDGASPIVDANGNVIGVMYPTDENGNVITSNTDTSAEEESTEIATQTTPIVINIVQ